MGRVVIGWASRVDGFWWAIGLFSLSLVRLMSCEYVNKAQHRMVKNTSS